MLYVGAQPSQKVEQRLCYHCGDLAVHSPVFKEEKVFCCTGCLAVYEILSENKLCTYYDLSNHPGRKQPGYAQKKGDFDFLDDEAEARKLMRFTDGLMGVVQFKIPTIHCSSCIWLLENLHKLCVGIQQVEVNFPRREVTIRFDCKQFGLKNVVQALHNIGYPPLLQWDVSSAGSDAEGLARKRLLGQLGVAGFCLGNIMLLSFPEYLQPGGVSTGFRHLFAYVSLLLALPLVFYAASDYLLSAWNGIRGRFFTIDQPLALGILAMFLRSSYEIISGEGGGYLDSLSALIFFLLVGKFLLQLTFRHLAFDRDYRAYFPMAVTLLKEDADATQVEKSVPISQIKIGDKLVVKQGEIVPTDSILTSENTSIDYSFITGESNPVTIDRGALVYAGGRQASGRAEFIAQRSATQGSLTQLWNHPTFKKNDSGYTLLVNQLSKYFAVTTVLVSLFSFVFWQAIDTARAWQAFTAVLIIACPCALAFAAPFAYGHITRVLGRYRFYLKNALVVEKLASLDTLVFDKTGTLTDAKISGTLSAFKMCFSPALSHFEMMAAGTLAAQSAHPLSRVLAQVLPQDKLEIVSFCEVKGSGISAFINGRLFKLGHATFCDAPSLNTPLTFEQTATVHFNVDSRYRGYFEVPQVVRQNVLEMLQEFRVQGYALQMLSGDTHQQIVELQQSFSSDEIHFKHSPASKLAFIEKLKQEGHHPAMVGDGLNDAGALRAADVGIAVSNDAGVFTPASDAIISAEALTGLPKFLRLSRLGKTIVWVCFAVSLIYNLTGVWFAVQGKLSPVIAAILMPFSSIGTILLASGLAYIAAWVVGLKIKREKTDLNQFLG